jgi:hypothetical protein
MSAFICLYLSLFAVCFTDSYETARQKLDRAAETSTLETDQEEVSLLSRKNRKKKTVLSSDSEEETKVHKKSVPPASRKLVESTLPEPPASLQMSTPSIQSIYFGTHFF